MDNYTIFKQLRKSIDNIRDFYSEPTSFISKLEKNDYDKSFMDENNNEPILSIIGSVSDLFSGRLQQIKAIGNFDISRYLGKWYEIARFNSSFEGEDIISATAEYEKIGEIIHVTNTGIHSNGHEEVIKGTASLKYPGTTIGKLDVTFFPPFTGNYWIIMIGENYQYSVVTSPNGKYLWILSRTTSLSDFDSEEIRNKLESLGYDLSRLHWSKF